MSHCRGLVILFLLALLLGLAFQGSRGLYETTEGRYAEVGREMLETGNWMVPQLDYRPHWTKPPLTYWTIAAGIAVAGPTALGARLGNALIFPLLVLAVAWLGTLLWDTRTGLLAGLIYATSLFPAVAASTISTDLVLTLWEVLAAAFYWKAVRVVQIDGEGDRGWVLAFWTVTGLAFLTKGPPGLLTLLATVAFQLAARRKGWVVPRLVRPEGLVTFALVGFGWYLDVVLRTPGLLTYLVRDELLRRVATNHFRRNPEWYKPPFIYGPPLVLGLGAWLAHLGSARVGLRRAGISRPIRRALASGPVRLFLGLWLLLPLALLSLSRSRLALYVLPFFGVLPLVLARGLTWSFPVGRILARRTAWTAGIMSVALIGLKWGSGRFSSSSDMSRLYALVALAGDPHASRVVAVGDSPLYGLQYYLSGRLDRISTHAMYEERDVSLRRFLPPGQTGADSAAMRPAWVFLARDTDAMRTLCTVPFAVCHDVAADNGWHIWRMDVRTAD